MFRNYLNRDPQDDGGGATAAASYNTLMQDDDGEYSFATSEDQDDDDDDNVPTTDGGEEQDDILRPGDHIYVQVGFSQRHGIVYKNPYWSNQDNNNNSCACAILEEDDNDNNNGNGSYEERKDEADEIIILSFYDDAMAKEQSKGNIFTNLFQRKDVSSREIEEDEQASQAMLTSSSMSSHNSDTTDDTTSHDNNNHDTSTSSSSPLRTKTLREFTFRQFMRTSSSKATKVHYGVSRAKRLLSRSGSATCLRADLRGLVLSRARYLFHTTDSAHYDWPPYQKFSANDECVAVWCRTGRWVTLQAASMLEILSMGPASSALVAGTVAAHTSVTYTVPWIPGYVLAWSVPTTVAYPILIPLLVGYGLTSLVPLEVLRRNRAKWRDISDQWNRRFWSEASDETRMEYFGQSEGNNQDEDLQRFFGFYSPENNDGNNNDNNDNDEEEKDNSEGQYMPLNLDGEESAAAAAESKKDGYLATPIANTGASSSGREEDLKEKLGGFFRGISERFTKGIHTTTTTNPAMEETMTTTGSDDFTFGEFLREQEPKSTTTTTMEDTKREQDHSMLLSENSSSVM